MSDVIHWGHNTDIYLHIEPVDFRKSINGLSLIVEDAMALSSMSGSLFVFSNKKRDKLKALYWDESGFALWYKRLEKEKFKWPKNKAQSTLSIDPEQWDWLLRGFDINRMQAHKKIHFSALS